MKYRYIEIHRHALREATIASITRKLCIILNVLLVVSSGAFKPTITTISTTSVYRCSNAKPFSKWCRVSPKIANTHNSISDRPKLLFMTDDGQVNDETNNMEELVISLSLEPTDDSRRSRLSNLFENKLAEPDEAREEFVNSFASALNIVGDRVQTQLRQKAAAAAAELEKQSDKSEVSSSVQAIRKAMGTEEEEEEDNDEKSVTAENKSEESGESIDQSQLWALVDMMVQSKTLVKKDQGELGSKGSFR